MQIFLLLFFFFFNLTYSLNLCEEKFFNFRIIGGQRVFNETTNWMGKLVSFGETNEGILCGATVIDDYWILTAAHCAVQLKKRSYVVFRDQKTEKEVTITVLNAYVHPEYDNRTADNDIALLQTSTNLVSKGIPAVCLLKNDDNILSKYPNGIVMGFGLSFDKIPNTTNNFILEGSEGLQQTTVPIIPSNSCRTIWNRLSFRSVIITPNQLCAGSFLHGTAPGDSGGPLLVKKLDGTFVQLGITSFGADGLDGLIDQGTYPGVYTRVSKYLPWIEKVVKNGTSSEKPFNFPFFFIYISLFMLFSLI